MIIAIFAWIFSALICYLFLRRTVYNVADPLVFDNIAIPFSAALLAVLCAAELVSIDKLILFSLVLLAFLTGARIALAFFGRNEFRSAISRTVSRFSAKEIYGILIVTMIVTVVLTVLAIQSGGQGDGRAEFNRVFRPLAVLRSGMFLFSLLVLLSPKLSIVKVAVWLGTLVLLSIAFAGKAVFIPIFYWFGLKFFLTNRRVTMTTLVPLAFLMLVGSSVMGLFAYGASSGSDLFLLIANRFWLYGDVYIYAYKLNALSDIRGDYKVSFLAYMLHPLTSLVGVRGYEKPLGSMIMSAATQRDVLNGPNPQLPVLLDFFFPGQLVASMAVALTIGAMVFALRAAGVRLTESRSRYLALGGIAVAIFGPPAGFVDTSQVLIALVGIVIVTVLGAAFELLPLRLGRRALAFDGVPASN